MILGRLTKMSRNDKREFKSYLRKSKNVPTKITRNARNPSKLFFSIFSFARKKNSHLKTKMHINRLTNERTGF